MNKENNRTTHVISLAAWCLVITGTFLLSLSSIFVLWPISYFFDRASGYLPHKLSQLWALLISRFLPLWEIQIEGLERIHRDRPYVVVSNHQSLLDILVVLAGLPLHFKFISKQELFWIPFFGWHMFLAGYIPLKRGDRLSGKECLRGARYWLRRGVSVVFFPEGTRSLDGKIHEFKAGAFKLALEEKVNILPLVIVGTREVIPKKSWYVQKRTRLRFQICEPVSTENFSLEDLDRIRIAVRETIRIEFEKVHSIVEREGL